MVSRVASLRKRPENGCVLRVLGGPLRGRLLVMPRFERPSLALGTYESHVASELIRRLGPGDHFFDVGANIGYFSLLASKLVGNDGSVVAVEASPMIRPFLHENLGHAAHDNVTVLPIALGASTGTVEFASFELYSTVGHVFTDETPGDAQVDEVDLDTIDRLVTTGTCPAPSLIKIDVEGSELQVLEGCAHVLETVRPQLIVEVRPQTVVAVQALMAAANYDEATLSGGSGNERGGVADVLFTPRFS